MTKYFTQFDESTQTIGTNLAGWTTRGTVAPSSYAPAYGTPAVKKRYLNYKTNSSAIALRNIISQDAIDADANRANVELLSCFSYDATTANTGLLWARGVGASGAAPSEAYAARIQITGTIYVSKRTSATALTDITSTAFTFAAGKSYFVRFRVNSTAIKLRVWDAALGMAGEPTTWNIDTTDATFSSAGWVGVGAVDASVDKIFPWNFLAVATNGDSAVCPRTNTEYTAWLDSQNAIRCVLAEMSATGYDSGGSPYTKTVNVYLSNHGYTSQQQDTPSLRHYDNFIQQIPTFTREMSTALSGQATTGFGDLIISNPASTTVNTGVRDNWLRMRWNRNYLKMYLGDPSWPKHDFRLMIYGRLGMPSAPAPNQIKFPIADLSDALNAPLQTSQFSSGDYDGQYKPAMIGATLSPIGVEPPLTAASTLTYTVSDSAITGWAGGTNNLDFLVKDEGILIATVDPFTSATPTISAVDTGTETMTSVGHGLLDGAEVQFFSGTPPTPLALATPYFVIAAGLTTDNFRLSATRGGAAINLTVGTTGASFIGVNYIVDTAAATVQLLAQPSGRVTVGTFKDSSAATWTFDRLYEECAFTRLGLSLNFKDSATFTTLQTTCASNSYDGGVWIDTQQHRAADVIAQIAAGTFTWYGFTPDGLMQVGLLSLPSATAVLSFTESDVVAGSLRLVDVIRSVDFSSGLFSYKPVYLQGGPLGSSLKAARQMKVYLTAYTYGAAGVPLDDHPDRWDANDTRNFDSIIAFDTAASNMRTHLAGLFKQTLGIFEFTTRLSATQLNIGDTISLTHPRYEWKQYTGADDASPDNTGTVEARYAVVIGIATDVARGTTKIKCFRRIPGYYPTTDLN